MDMKWRKLVAMGCIVTMTAVLTVGCGGTSAGSSTSTESTEATEEQESEAVTLQVTAVDGSTITGDVGEMSEAPSGDRAPGGAPQGSPFAASGETQTFTLTDTTEITVESAGNTTEGTADDITVGSILEVTLDTDGNALTVIVKNMNGGGGPQGDFGGSSEVTNGTSANTIDEDTSVDGAAYTSNGDDENALRVDGAAADLSNITVEKTAGSSSNTEDGDWYGQNAGLLALNGATVNITGATVNTSVQNGNGVFSYGEGTTVNISDSTIRTKENNSGGIHTTGGGTMNADNLDVETSGNSAAAIRSDRGGGDVNVTGNASGAAGTVNVTLSDDSTWTLTGDSYVTSFSGDLSHVTANGFHLYVNGEQAL